MHHTEYKNILARLFAPPFHLLLRLHHKFEFSKLTQDIGLDVPEAPLCTSMDDVLQIPMDRYPHGIALKPVSSAIPFHSISTSTC